MQRKYTHTAHNQYIQRKNSARSQIGLKNHHQSPQYARSSPKIYRNADQFHRTPTYFLQHAANFKKAIALIIKKYTSDCAKLSGDKSHLLNYIYTLLMTNQLQFAAKDVLGTALEHLLISDNGKQWNYIGQYRRILLEKVIDVMNSENSLSMFDGCLIALNAYFNTIKNIEDQL